jgi:integrase/recombinase XerD
MEAKHPTVSPLRQRMLDDMRMRKLGAEDAELDYVRAGAASFARVSCAASPDTATVEDLRRLPVAPGRPRRTSPSLAERGDQRD